MASGTADGPATADVSFPAYETPRAVAGSRVATVVLCENPSAMTMEGTNSAILRAPGAAASVVIDPGPEDAGHARALAEALDEAERLGEVPHGAPFVELPEPKFSLLDTVLELSGVGRAKATTSFGASGEDPVGVEASEQAQTPVPLPRDLIQVARALLPFAVWSADTPLAVREGRPLEEP